MNRIRELRKRMGVSMNTLARRLQIAESTLGYWERGVYEPSRDMLVELSSIFSVPIDYILGNDEAIERHSDNWIPVYGKVAAGIPIEEITDIVDMEEIPAEWLKDGSKYLALEIHGESMMPNFREGDHVLVRRQPDVENGEIAIVQVNGDSATCKKIKKTTEGMFLLSLNPAYEPIFYSAKDVETLPVEILGRVMENRQKY